MTDNEIAQRAEALGPWYHEVQLGSYTTKSYMVQWLAPIWEMVRQKMTDIDYQGKTVLDLGTMDGYWAFRAEQRGPSLVVAGDIWQGSGTVNPVWPWARPGNAIERFMFAREILGSKVVPVVNAEVQCLHDRLKTVMRCHAIQGFDVIQCLGLLYHVQNPMLALHQIRKCLAKDGVMLLETACYMLQYIAGCNDEPVMRLNRAPLLYDDRSSYWLPNELCLAEMLAATGFTMDPGISRVSQAPKPLNRICVVCRAAAPPTQAEDNFGT